jgi:hypothetical protein
LAGSLILLFFLALGDKLMTKKLSLDWVER